MHYKAFTLIELIIVIAIIAIIAVFSFVTVDPGKRIGQAKDDERLTEVRSIEEAIDKYTVDNRVLPNSISSANDGLYMITMTALLGQVSCGGLDIDELNINTELDNYLPSLPLEPDIIDESTQGTGYFLVKDENSIQIGSCDKYDTNSFNFICGGPLTDTRDDQGYATLQIGSQCWMKQGLNIGIMIDAYTTTQNDNDIIEKYCYDNDEDNCSLNNNPIYSDGGLYQLHEAMSHMTTAAAEGTQGICPNNWHVPSDYEIQILEMYLGMNSGSAQSNNWRGTDQGDQLKTFSECANEINCGLSNFEGNLAGGFWGGNFSYRVGDVVNQASAFFWSSSLNSIGSTSRYRQLHWNMGGVWRNWSSDDYGYSVRCLKDKI